MSGAARRSGAVVQRGGAVVQRGGAVVRRCGAAVRRGAAVRWCGAAVRRHGGGAAAPGNPLKAARTLPNAGEYVILGDSINAISKFHVNESGAASSIATEYTGELGVSLSTLKAHRIDLRVR